MAKSLHAACATVLLLLLTARVPVPVNECNRLFTTSVKVIRRVSGSQHRAVDDFGLKTF